MIQKQLNHQTGSCFSFQVPNPSESFINDITLANRAASQELMSMDRDIEKQQHVDIPLDEGTHVDSDHTHAKPDSARPSEIGTQKIPSPSSQRLKQSHPFGILPGPSRKATLGSRKTEPVYDPSVGATYDYTIKYKPDPLFHELDENARVWLVYNDEATAFDTDIIDEASDSLDILLVFAGLFSAVVTTFVVQTSQALAPNSAAISASLLKELVALQRAQAGGIPVSSVPLAQEVPGPSGSDKWVNWLWFTSLTLSLSSALCAVLAKQWIRQYRSLKTGSARDRALLRHYRYKGLKRWRVLPIIRSLPTLLHISLILFLIGLAIFLASLDSVIAAVVGSIAILLSAFYLTTNLLPVFIPHCSYRTPLSFLISRLLRPVYHLRNIKRREHMAVNTWRLMGSGILEVLQWLRKTTSNLSAVEVVDQAVVALGLPSSSTGSDAIQYEQDLQKLSNDVHITRLQETEVNFSTDGDLRNVEKIEKDEVQRRLMGYIFLQHTGFFSSEEGVDSRLRESLPKSYQILASDIDLGLIALASGSNESVTISIKHIDDDTTEPIDVLQRKDALTWAINNHRYLNIPRLPIVVWDELWKIGSWDLSNVDGRADISPEGKTFIREAFKLDLQVSSLEAATHRHGRVPPFDYLRWKAIGLRRK